MAGNRTGRVGRASAPAENDGNAGSISAVVIGLIIFAALFQFCVCSGKGKAAMQLPPAKNATMFSYFQKLPTSSGTAVPMAGIVVTGAIADPPANTATAVPLASTAQTPNAPHHPPTSAGVGPATNTAIDEIGRNTVINEQVRAFYLLPSLLFRNCREREREREFTIN
jgi:hypothetical protein